jgi:hypothetical protein
MADLGACRWSAAGTRPRPALPISFYFSAAFGKIPAMTIERDSVQFRVLERLCSMPKPVRGISGAMLERHFGSGAAVEALAGAGLIAARGWANGPGAVWVPTAAGEALWRELTDGRSEPPPFQPVRTPSDSARHPRKPPDRR